MTTRLEEIEQEIDRLDTQYDMHYLQCRRIDGDIVKLLEEKDKLIQEREAAKARGNDE